MRQAGRSLPEYRAARGRRAASSRPSPTPSWPAEITLQPVRRYGVDAAILFSDIVVPGRTPSASASTSSPAGARSSTGRSARPPTSTACGRSSPRTTSPYVVETVRLVAGGARRSGVPLIGFAGAPFTVASYLVEGGPSRTFAKVKALMHGDPDLWGRSLDRLADHGRRLPAGPGGGRGAGAVQLFDSWAGCALARPSTSASPCPPPGACSTALADLGVPTILFGVGTGELLGLMASAGADVVGVDWRVPLDEARRRVGPGAPCRATSTRPLCLAPVAGGRAEAPRRAGRGPATGAGHVFNLGHGVLPETDPGILAAVVDLVHAEGRAGRSAR